MIHVDGSNYVLESGWSGSLLELSLPGASGMILGGGIGLHSNFVYVCEHGTGSVRRISRDIDMSQRTVDILANEGTFKYPQDLIVTNSGVVLLNDLYGNVMYLLREDEVSTTSADTTKKEWLVELAGIDLNYPRGLTRRERDGKLFVSELNPNRVIEVVFEEGHGLY